jgi:RNA polymerase sigma-70 factor (ECF subfamily)
LPETSWIEPIPDRYVIDPDADPAEAVEMRESVRLAFVAALQLLAPKQRAVLVLRDVLRWKATEVAELLGTSIAAVNSALQRARATIAGAEMSPAGPQEPMDERAQTLLALYVDAFERYDIDSLTALLHEDATWSMPPYELWLNTHRDIRKWCLGPGAACRGSILVETEANGSPAFAQYKPSADGGYDAWALHVLEISGGRITGICFFLDVEWIFPMFGLPPRLLTETFSDRPRLVEPISS